MKQIQIWGCVGAAVVLLVLLAVCVWAWQHNIRLPIF